jgi:hypothetical protein
MGNTHLRTQGNHEIKIQSGISAAELGRNAEHDVIGHALSTRSRSFVVTWPDGREALSVLQAQSSRPLDGCDHLPAG